MTDWTLFFRQYNKAGYFIKRIYCDNEFCTLVNDLQDDLDVEVICVAAGEHVSEAERNNRTIGERIRAGYHRVPYRVMPRVILKTLAKKFDSSTYDVSSERRCIPLF